MGKENKYYLVTRNEIKYLTHGQFVKYSKHTDEKQIKKTGFLVEKRENSLILKNHGRIWTIKLDEYDIFCQSTQKFEYDKIFLTHNPEYEYITCNSNDFCFIVDKYISGKLKMPPKVQEIKTKLEKITFLMKISGVYILELEEGYYYIGESNDIYRRIFEHFLKMGSKLTLLYKPVKIIKFYEINDKLERIEKENNTTEEYINIYGAHKVRGGIYV
jgi:predicted GIY-YIG superfamily endonuclease